MQWNFNMPGGHPSLNLGGRELERRPLTHFLDCLPREKPDMFTAARDPALEDGVRLWLDGIDKPDGQGPPARPRVRPLSVRAARRERSVRRRRNLV